MTTQNGQSWSILTKKLDFPGDLSTFGAGNTPKSGPLKTAMDS